MNGGGPLSITSSARASKIDGNRHQWPPAQRPFGADEQTSRRSLDYLGFRQFLLRGLEKVRAEWAMICTAHNILKLFTLAKTA